MTTWTSPTKSKAAEADFLFSDGLDFLFSDGTDYVFKEGADLTWTAGTKNSASWTSATKHSASWTSPENSTPPTDAAIVQYVVGADVSDTTYTATLASPPTLGNIVIMIAAASPNFDTTTFATPVPAMTNVVISNGVFQNDDIGMWYVAADPGTDTYTISHDGSDTTGVVVLIEVSGLDLTDPVDVYASNPQTTTNSRTAYTGQTAESARYGFAIAAVMFADNDFTAPTTASWTSDSSATLTQLTWDTFATENDFSLGIAYANVNRKEPQGATLTVTGGGTTEQRNSIIAVFNR